MRENKLIALLAGIVGFCGGVVFCACNLDEIQDQAKREGRQEEEIRQLKWRAWRAEHDLRKIRNEETDTDEPEESEEEA